MVLLKRQMCQIAPWVMMSQADPNGSSILVLWAECDTSHFFFVCQMSLVFPCCITPPRPLSLSQTLQWSITSNTAICHECLMSHRDRKLFDHMIRHSIKNLVLWQPWCCSCQWTQSVYVFANFLAQTVCFVLFSTYIFLHYYLQPSCLLFSIPSLFYLGAHLSPLTALSWAGSPTSLCCLKI